MVALPASRVRQAYAHQTEYCGSPVRWISWVARWAHPHVVVDTEIRILLLPFTPRRGFQRFQFVGEYSTVLTSVPVRGRGSSLIDMIKRTGYTHTAENTDICVGVHMARCTSLMYSSLSACYSCDSCTPSNP